MGQLRAVLEIHRRIARGRGDVRVRGEVEDGPVARHGGDQTRIVADVAFDDPQSPILGEPIEVLTPADREIVVDRDPLSASREQTTNQVRADEARATRNKTLFHLVFSIPRLGRGRMLRPRTGDSQGTNLRVMSRVGPSPSRSVRRGRVAPSAIQRHAIASRAPVSPTSVAGSATSALNIGA